MKKERKRSDPQDVLLAMAHVNEAQGLPWTPDEGAAVLEELDNEILETKGRVKKNIAGPATGRAAREKGTET